MDIQKLTKEQAVIISGFTGILCGEFSDFHADVEKRLGRGVQTFEFGFKEFSAEVKRLYEADFIEMGTVSKEEAKAQAATDDQITVSYERLQELIEIGVKAALEAQEPTKAQAVPEGFVLVEKTKLMQIIGSAAIIEPITRGNPLMSKYKTELDFILSTVRAMIEAQEQKG